MLFHASPFLLPLLRLPTHTGLFHPPLTVHANPVDFAHGPCIPAVLQNVSEEASFFFPHLPAAFLWRLCTSFEPHPLSSFSFKSDILAFFSHFDSVRTFLSVQLYARSGCTSRDARENKICAPGILIFS